MSDRAGYDIGKDIGRLMERKFISKPTKITSKTGQILGLSMLVVGAMTMVLVSDDTEIAPLGFLIGIGGVALLLLLHWIALQMNKKYIPKE